MCKQRILIICTLNSPFTLPPDTPSHPSHSSAAFPVKINRSVSPVGYCPLGCWMFLFAVRSQAQQPCCTCRRQHFTALLSVLQLLLLPLLQVTWALEGSEDDIDISLRAEHLMVTYFQLFDQIQISVLTADQHNQKFSGQGWQLH